MTKSLAADCFHHEAVIGVEDFPWRGKAYRLRFRSCCTFMLQRAATNIASIATTT